MEPPQLTRIFEEIPANNEVLVGNPGISYDQYGNKTVTQDYLQFSAGTSIYTYIVGTTTAPAPNTDCVLKISEATNDGTLIRTRRTFINAGELSDTEQLKFGGKLLLRELTYLNQVPPTPMGWTLVTQSTEFIHGLPVYRYGFANGNSDAGAGGVVSTETVYNRSPDQGDTGVTVTTIKQITDSSIVLDPTTGPVGSQLISVQYEDEDGYRMWTAIYAAGQGVVSSTVETKNEGALKIYSKTAINAAPPDPSPTIGGTVVLIRSDVSNGTRVEDGTVVYEYQWAEGKGTITSDVETKNGGLLVIYSITSLGVAPSAPSPTIGGTVTQIDADTKQSDGYVIYSYRWAEGIGEIGREINYQQSQNQGTLGVTITTIRYLVATGATVQPTSLSGSVEIGRDFSQGDGFKIWTTKWAKGTGLVAEEIHARQDGLREVTDTSLGTRIAPSGVVIRDDYRIESGFTVYTVTAIQASDGSAVTSATVVFERFVPFLYPGRAKAYSLTASNGWIAYDVFRSPPVSSEVNATITVTYQTSNSLGSISDYWNPSEWACIQSQWIGLNNLPGYAVVALPGYRSVDSTALTFTASVWAGGVAGTMLGNIVFGGTTAVVRVTGGPSDPGGHTFTLDATIEPAFTATDGTKYYRKTIVSAAIPAQASLPV